MSLLSVIAVALQICAVPWVDLAEQEMRAATMAQEVGSERLAIQARFSRAKAFALTGVDETVDPLVFNDRLSQIRASGDLTTAGLVEELQRQAAAEERWAHFLAEQNASVQLAPGDTPTQIPTRPTPPPNPTPAGQGTTGAQPPLGPDGRPLATGSQPPLGPDGLPLPSGIQPPLATAPSTSGTPPAAASPSAGTPPKGSTTTGGPQAPVRTEDTRYLLSIPKIGLADIPIIETDIFDQGTFLSDLRSGVAQAFCHPGEPCKSVIFGHSSGFANDVSNYKRVFVRLNELEVGDTVKVNYRSRSYTYVVFKKEIVAPDAVEILKNYDWEELTLFTCWPINTWQKRLVVYTKRV